MYHRIKNLTKSEKCEWRSVRMKVGKIYIYILYLNNVVCD